jgi:hypothetical protein
MAMKPSSLFSFKQMGFSVLEALAGVAISGVVMLGTSALYSSVSKSNSASEASFWVSTRRAEFQSLIRSTKGWESIVAENPYMACFKTGSACTAFTSPQPLKVKITNDVLVDGSLPQQGMKQNGDFCTSFSIEKEDPNCPIGVKLNWQAICDTAECFHPQPKINIQFATAVDSKLNFNTPSYQLVSFKDPRLDSMSDVCASMGGDFSDGKKCKIPALETNCDPANGSFVLGFDATGIVICGKPNPGSCAANDLVTGFSAAGGVICTPACP